MRISVIFAAETDSQPDKGQAACNGNMLTAHPELTCFLYKYEPSTSMTGALASTASCIL